ncbi:putative membrane protein [hydrothermal vent metagenome]|uniref:Putative membrane protein n=1 Tax=hydrothermal vent metagenome TaxID=652676 RepID=A0A3B1CX65_9ZZZZ
MDSNEHIEDEVYYNRIVTASLRIGFIALLLLLSYVILKPFLILVVWSIIIAVGIYPIFLTLSKSLGDKKKLASTIIVLTALALIIVPSVLMLNSTVESVQDLKMDFEAGTLSVPPPSQDIAEWPVIGKSVYDIWSKASTNLESTLVEFEPQIKEFIPKLLDSIAGLGSTILLTIISIIIAGVLLLKPESSEETTHKVFRLLIGKDSKELTDITIMTIRSVVQGILGIAIIQSVAAGILMFAFGIPGAGLWALIVLFLAIIQLPPALVLVPIAIYGFGIMGTTPAVIFLILAIIISASDAFLKPLFLGRGIDIPMLVILLGAIGGVIVFGILGLFIGAVVLAIAYKMFQALVNEKVWIK